MTERKMQDVKMTELKMQDVKMMELIGRFKNDRPDRKGENDEREISIVLIVTLPNCFCFLLFGPGRRVPKSHSIVVVVVVVVVISSLSPKNP